MNRPDLMTQEQFEALCDQVLKPVKVRVGDGPVTELKVEGHGLRIMAERHGFTIPARLAVGEIG